MFMAKNTIEILLATTFIAINLAMGLNSGDYTQICQIELVGHDSVIHMQCRQKRYSVFINLLYVFTGTLSLHVMVNCCSLAWGSPVMKLRSPCSPSSSPRKISGLMKELQEAIKTTKAYWPSLRVIRKGLAPTRG